MKTKRNGVEESETKGAGEASKESEELSSKRTKGKVTMGKWENVK